MKKLLISFGDGPHEELLQIAAPSFLRFAARHNYDTFLPKLASVKNICHEILGWSGSSRPASWLKVALLEYGYRLGYDVVLWVDADVVMVRNDYDPADLVPQDKMQGMVFHQVSEGIIPNCGVWFTRKIIHEMGFLRQIWLGENWSHYWWEQKRVLELMEDNLRYKELTQELPFFLNVHKNDFRLDNSEKQWYHATMYASRSEIMRKWAHENS